MGKYVELTEKCKNCGFEQTYMRNLDYPQGRIVCQECGAVIVRKAPQPRPKQESIVLANRYNTWCRKCKKVLGKGQPVYWTPGKRGVLCTFCKGDKKVKIRVEKTE
jgi:DNA-directed RNA polymerase subunit RPC12/RpoP